MSQEARNTETLRMAYQLWHDSKGASSEHWMGLLAEDIRFGSLAQGRPDSLAFTQTRANRDGVGDYLKSLTGDWEMIEYVVDHFVAQGDRVVAVGHTAWRNKRTGKSADSPKVDVWRFSDDGKAVEFFEYYDTALLAAASQ